MPEQNGAAQGGAEEHGDDEIHGLFEQIDKEAKAIARSPATADQLRAAITGTVMELMKEQTALLGRVYATLDERLAMLEEAAGGGTQIEGADADKLMELVEVTRHLAKVLQAGTSDPQHQDLLRRATEIADECAELIEEARLEDDEDEDDEEGEEELEEGRAIGKA